MALNRNNFQQVLTPVHQYLGYDQYAELPEQYSEVFTGSPMRLATETYQREGAFGLWDSNNEGGTINEDSMSEGPTVSYTAVRYDKGYDVTWELAQDDLYKVFGGAGKDGSAQNLARGARATVESNAASVLNDGFTNTGFDGTSLFANDHELVNSAESGNNLATGALTDANLKAANIVLRKQKDEAGILIMDTPGHLIVPPDLEYDANAIIYSAGTPGNDFNDKNTLPGMKICVMDYLTSTTAWFTKAKRTRNLVFKWRDRLWFDSQFISRKIDFFQFGVFRSTQGYDDWRGVVGSTGA